MNSTLIIITLTVLIILLVIAAVAYALYKARFQVDRIRAKLPGIVEVEASRPKTATPADNSTDPPLKIHQRAGKGGKIIESGISAPAGAAAEIDQQATDKGEINDSPIKLT